MNRNIIRQVIDIQSQAERLISQNAEETDIELFSQYNRELKSFLISNIKDEFVLNYIKEIPDLNMMDLESESGFFERLIALFSNGYSSDRMKNDRALDIIREIKNKYASSEFMIKNYFNE
tara:strand:+ start:113 stop:472 length:360 start_codon:yes stop_codon:yes gene_type:complete